MTTTTLFEHKHKLLFVSPIISKEHIDESGLIIPQNVGAINETATVFKSEPGSFIKEGDTVIFNKLNYEDKDGIDHEIISLDGENYVVIREDQVWAINDEPHGFIFVTPMSEIEITEDGIAIPESVKGIPKKGIVFSACRTSAFKKDDRIEYRKREGGVYPIANMDGILMDVLRDRDVFTVNGNVSPNRIIVQIDKGTQKISRETADSGLKLSPLFIKMLHNLQYGVCVEIGALAQDMYPEMKVGDTLILHHTFEEQDYRILRKEKGKHGIKYEYRVANCFDINSREIFGKFDVQKLLGGKVKKTSIIPFGDYVFLDWTFDLFEKKPISDSEIIADFDFNIQNCHNRDTLDNVCKRLIEEAAEKYAEKYKELQQQFISKDPNDNHQLHEAQMIGRKIEQMKREAQQKGQEVQKDHVVICKQLWPCPGKEDKVLLSYKGAYPILIQKKKFLIVSKKDILSTYKTSTNIMDKVTITPTLDRILIKPIEEPVMEFDLVIPDSAKEPTRTGIVESLGPLADGNTKYPKVGDTVYFRRGRGIPLPANGENYLLMGLDDTLCTIMKS